VGSTGEVWCDTVQDWRILEIFGVALYKTGEYWRYLVWHCKRLENTGDIWCVTVQDWRILVIFGVSLYKAGEYW
jgi:hypothetical protein